MRDRDGVVMGNDHESDWNLGPCAVGPRSRMGKKRQPIVPLPSPKHCPILNVLQYEKRINGFFCLILFAVSCRKCVCVQSILAWLWLPAFWGLLWEDLVPGHPLVYHWNLYIYCSVYDLLFRQMPVQFILWAHKKVKQVFVFACLQTQLQKSWDTW